MEACKTGCMSALLMSLAISLLTKTSYGDSWTYKGNHGVSHWAELFSRNCAGKFQSPVDLSPMSMKKDSKLGDFTFTNFDDVTDVVQELWNNGHTAQVSYLSGDLRVNGGGLRSEYKVLQFHFHWGSDNTQGSEHTISGVPYPMEMHVVTYNVHYDNFTNALNYADGLAVLGVFFEVGNFGNCDFDTLTKALPSVKTPGSTILLDPVPLNLLLPFNTEKYYRYQGSLTSPPCNEAVTWTLFRDPVILSDDKLEAFRGLQALERDEITNAHLPMVDNFRPTQPLHGREIKTSF
ncbi:carbonic anhydrase 3-like isoform X2 [Littorina saxatilis]|uniref:carbonic anhydrase 3-like isoform X2 n=1 Tax=Littorina saxatilis TaxID=31220 RepID=UPI0038B45966